MNFFCRKTFTAFLFLSFAFNARAVNDTLTIQQAFDWKVGDSLYYRPYEFFQCHPAPGVNSTCYQYYPLRGFTVSSRQTLGDTIQFVLQCTENPMADTVMVSHLDSGITAFPGMSVCYIIFETAVCDSGAISCSFNSLFWLGALKGNTISIGYHETGVTSTYLEKIGVFTSQYSALEYQMGVPGGNGVSLAYYKSDSITWIDSTLFYYNNISEQTTTPTFQLSPNPANETITLNAEKSASSEPFNVLVYDITGACVRNIQPNSIRSLTIPVNDLSPGYYVIKVSNGNHYLAAKGFIIAR